MQEVALHPTHFMATVLNMNANRWMSSAEMVTYAKSHHIRLDTTSVASTQTILNSAANQSKINFEKKTELKTILYRLTETGISLIQKGWIKITTPNKDFTRTSKHEQQTPNTTAERLQEMMRDVCYSPYEENYPSDDSNDEDYGKKGSKRKRVYHNPDERRMINVALQVLHFENRSMAPGDIHKRAYEIDIEVPRATNTKLLARSMKHSDFFIRERNVGHAYFSLSATGVQAAKQLAKESSSFNIDYGSYETTECSVLSVETSTIDTIICECSEYVEADDNEIQLMVDCSTCNKTMFVSYKNDYLERKKQRQSQLASINTTKRTIAQVTDAENRYSHKRQKLSQEPISRTPILA
jgi:hypothetical protein